MVINHLIVGSSNVSDSVKFYCDFLGFSKTSDDPGAADGAVLVRDQSELLIIPFPEAKLPNPVHFALEVKTNQEFDYFINRAEKMKLAPRATSMRNSEKGSSVLSRAGQTYKIFYIYDPSGVNLEVMVRENA